MPLSFRILRLRSSGDILLIGARAEFGRSKALRHLENEDDIRMRLVRIQWDSHAMAELRRFWNRWHGDSAYTVAIADRTLIDEIARMAVGGPFAVYVAPDALAKRGPAPRERLAEAREAVRKLAPIDLTGRERGAVSAPSVQIVRAGTSLPLLTRTLRAPVTRLTLDVNSMSRADRVGEVWRRMWHSPRLTEDAKFALADLVSPQALAFLVAAFVVWVGSQFFGAGEIIDGLLLVQLLGEGMSFFLVLDIGEKFVDLVRAIGNAKTTSDLDHAADLLAEIIVLVGVQVFLRLILHATGRGFSALRKTGYAYEAPPQPRPSPQRLLERPVAGPIAGEGIAPLSDGGIPLQNGIRYGGFNGPGPLGADVASSFRSGSYTQEVLRQEITLYRVYGGEAGPIGSYWTDVPPAGPLQSILDSALNPEWGNTLQSVATIRVPAGTTVYRGFAASQPLTGGGSLMGGGSQVYIPKVNPRWLVN